MNNHTILIDERHNVRNGTDRGQSDGTQQKLTHLRCRFFAVSHAGTDRPRQFERHADTTQLPKRIWLFDTRQPGMNQHRRIRQRFTKRMVVGHNQFQTQFFRQRRFDHAADSTVHRHQQPLRIVAMQLPNRITIQPITLFQTTRNIVIDLRTTELQTVPQQTGRSHAVNVVIPINCNPATRFERLNNSVRRLFHTRQCFRVVQRGQFLGQIHFGRFRLVVTARHQHLRHHGGNLQPDAKVLHITTVVGRNPPDSMHRATLLS